MAQYQGRASTYATTTVLDAKSAVSYTAFGGRSRSGANRVQGCLHIKSNAGANKPAFLLMDAIADDATITTYGIWVDSTGDVRIVDAGAAGPDTVTNQDGDGAVVGGQS